MFHTFALTLALALAPVTTPEPTLLPPEAARHNKAAMVFYDNGQLAPAFDEFQAAYAALPDARRDRAGREVLLGSMRATLLEQHAVSGDPAPLCRLQEVLQAHADALMAAHPNTPDMPELRSVRARHDEGKTQLAALGADACAAVAPSPPPSTESPNTQSPTATESTDATRSSASGPIAAPVRSSSPRPPDTIPPRHLQIAGGVTLGLSAVFLGLMTYGIVAETRHEERIQQIDARAAGRLLNLFEYDELLEHRQAAQSARSLAIGTGIAAGTTLVLGTTLFLLARRSARTQRWSAAPWWSPTGAGLTLRVSLGTTR